MNKKTPIALINNAGLTNIFNAVSDLVRIEIMIKFFFSDHTYESGYIKAHRNGSSMLWKKSRRRIK